MSVSWFLSCCTRLLITASVGFSSASAQQESELIRLVLEGVKHNESLIRNYQAKFSIERRWNRRALEKYVSQSERDSMFEHLRLKETCDITWEMGKFSLREAITYENDFADSVVAVYDGRFQKTYRPEHSTGLIKTTERPPLLQGIYRWMNQSFLNKSMSEYLEKSKIHGVEVTSEAGRQLFVLDVEDATSTKEVPIRLKICFDADRAYALKKVEFFRTDISEKPRLVLEVEKFKEIEPGVFFPTEACEELFRGGRGEPVVTLNSCRLVVEQVEVNVNLPPETFKFDFPVGTEVYDQFLGTGYQTGATKQHLDLIEELLVGERGLGKGRSENHTTLRGIISSSSVTDADQNSFERKQAPAEMVSPASQVEENKPLAVLGHWYFWASFLATLLVSLYVIAKVVRRTYRSRTGGA